MPGLLQHEGGAKHVAGGATGRRGTPGGCLGLSSFLHKCYDIVTRTSLTSTGSVSSANSSLRTAGRGFVGTIEACASLASQLVPLRASGGSGRAKHFGLDGLLCLDKNDRLLVILGRGIAFASNSSTGRKPLRGCFVLAWFAVVWLSARPLLVCRPRLAGKARKPRNHCYKPATQGRQSQAGSPSSTAPTSSKGKNLSDKRTETGQSRILKKMIETDAALGVRNSKKRVGKRGRRKEGSGR